MTLALLNVSMETGWKISNPNKKNALTIKSCTHFSLCLQTLTIDRHIRKERCVYINISKSIV